MMSSKKNYFINYNTLTNFINNVMPLLYDDMQIRYFFIHIIENYDEHYILYLIVNYEDIFKNLNLSSHILKKISINKKILELNDDQKQLFNEYIILCENDKLLSDLIDEDIKIDVEYVFNRIIYYFSDENIFNRIPVCKYYDLYCKTEIMRHIINSLNNEIYSILKPFIKSWIDQYKNFIYEHKFYNPLFLSINEIRYEIYEDNYKIFIDNLRLCADKSNKSSFRKYFNDTSKIVSHINNRSIYEYFIRKFPENSYYSLNDNDATFDYDILLKNEIFKEIYDKYHSSME